MWNLLSDPDHEAFARIVFHDKGSFPRILSKLASRPYSDRVYGHWSVGVFIIGTAPSYDASQTGAFRRILSIELPGEGFLIGFGETPSSEWGRRSNNGGIEYYGCWEMRNEADVVPLVDQIVTRDLDAISQKGTT